MNKQNQSPDSCSTQIWSKRIANLLREQDMTQLQLSQKSGVSTATISEWIGTGREPKIMGFKDVADALGVSTDYLLGADECTTPTNEEIHKMTGLSDKAIKELRRLQRDSKKNKGPATKELAACNYLLEAMDSTDLFESLYSYLLGEFYFLSRKKDLGADVIYTKSPDGEEKEVLVFAENYSHVYLSKALQALSLMKKSADEAKAEKDKAAYEAWLKSEDGKAFERENLEQQADYEDKED